MTIADGRSSSLTTVGLITTLLACGTARHAAIPALAAPTFAVGQPWLDTDGVPILRWSA